MLIYLIKDLLLFQHQSTKKIKIIVSQVLYYIIKISAIPYQYPFQRNYKLNKKKIKEQSTIQDMFFRTKVVKIKYSDQLITLDDFVQFRMQIQAFPYLNTQNLFLELNLLFSSRYYASQQEKFEGKPVAQVRMKLRDIQSGIFCYSEADFKQDYFSKLSFTLFSQIMYYKFQKYQPKSKQPSSKQVSRSKVDNFGKLLIWAKQNYLQAGEDPFDMFYSNYVKNLRRSNYLIQTKVNNYLTVKRKIAMRVSKKYLQLLGIKNTVEVDEKIFRQYLETYKQPLSLDDIPLQIQEIRIENFQFLNHMIEDIYHDQFQFEKMKEQYKNYIKEKFGERVFRNTLYQHDPNYQNALKQNKKIAKQMRNKNYSLTQYPIENQTFFNNKDDHQFIFYQITLPQYMKEGFVKDTKDKKYINGNVNSQQNKENQSWGKLQEKSTMLQQSNHETQSFDHQNVNKEDNQSQDQENSSNRTQKSDNFDSNLEFFSQDDVYFQKIKYNEKNMLIIMCHGFQGSSYDMTIIQKGLKSQLPNANYLLSRKNEEDTQGDIQKMGQKLADQVKYYIKAFMDEQKVIINFVGHSMGGIIARSSFRHLLKYKDQFGFYCSLSSPHLGYLNGVDNKIKAGLWVLRKWKPIKSLDQLSMQETKHPRKSFLYKLSKNGTLKYFRKLVFFSSFQDSYVSWHSARVTPHTSKNEDSRIQNQMVHNILGFSHGRNGDTTVHRLDINFNVKGNNIDNLIGRAAHINLIIQDSLFDVINTTLPRLFSLKQYRTGVEEEKQQGANERKGIDRKKQSTNERSGNKKSGNFKLKPKQGSLTTTSAQ